MFSNQLSRVLLLMLIYSHATLASDLAYPLIKVPTLNEYFIATTKDTIDDKNKIRVSLINLKESTISKANDITYVSNDRKIVEEFFSIEAGNIELFVLTSNELDENYGFKGITYNTFIYDIYDNNIELIMPPVNAFMNCKEGIDLENNSRVNCKYKTKDEILNYFKN